MERAVTVRDALGMGEKELGKAGVESPLAEAEYLLTHMLGVKRHGLYTDAGRRLDENELKTFVSYLERRKKGEPVQYITGVADFMGLPMRVTGATLIPRPETEGLVETFLDLARDSASGPGGPVVLDICTGSGCIAIAAAHFIKSARVYATDSSGPAIAVARENAKENGVGERITFLKGDLFSPLEGIGLEGEAGFVLSNPPYVSSGEIGGLEREVRDYEPVEALDGGRDGLDVIRRIIEKAPGFLRPGGYLVMEIGFGQAEKVAAIAGGSGVYDGVSVRKDLQGIERVLVARKRE